MQQIIATKKINKQKILTIFCKSIKLKLEDCKIIENLTIKIKYLLIRDKIYIFRNKNNILYVEIIKF